MDYRVLAEAVGQRDIRLAGRDNGAGRLLFVGSVENTRMNAVAGVGWQSCDHAPEARVGTALLPLMCGEVPVPRKTFAFRLEERDSSL